MGFLAEYLFGKVIQKLEDKINENSLYQKLTGYIPIVSSHNSQLKQLLEESVEIAKTNEIVAGLQYNDIISSIDENIDIIIDCIVLSKHQIPLSTFLIRLKYTNDNEEYRKQIETFYKSLYEQLHIKKQNYPTLQNIQIQNELGLIKDELETGFSKTFAGMSNIFSKFEGYSISLKTIIDSVTISYNDELNAIERKIEIREFTIAREMALNLEDKISKSNKHEEIEKLYALIINTYLLEGGRQEAALEYFDKLILHTKDDKKLKARRILCKVIKKDFQNAQIELDSIFHLTNHEEIDNIFFENQINLYFMSADYVNGEKFINENKKYIKNYQYFLALMLIQQRKINEAHNLLEENEYFFSDKDFGIQEIKILIRSHYLLQVISNKIDIEIINELRELSVEISKLIRNAGDCKKKISYLHSTKAIILAAIFEKESAKNEYEKALDLDSINYNALKNYPYLLLDNPANMNKGLQLIKKYLDEYPDLLEDKILYYSILTEINPEMVINELSDEINIDLKIYLVYALDITNQHTKAEIHLKEMLKEHENVFSIQFCAGWHYTNLKKQSLALESFMKAYQLCKNENDYNSVFYFLLRIVCSDHCLNKMIEIKYLLETKYSRTIILLKYPEQYIHLLLVLKKYDTCIDCCNELRQSGSSNDYIAIAEFTCYYNTKNFQKVKKILDENRINYSDDILIRMAHACASIGEYELTKEILKKTKKPESKEDFIILSRLLFYIKEYQSSLKMIHDAYLKFPNERSIQECFIQLVFGHHIQPKTNDITNSFGKCLYSYRISEYENKIIQEISIPKNASGEEILKLISEKFPNNSDIDKKMELICANRLPISFYKSIFGKSIFSIHDMIVNSTNIPIWCTEQFEKNWENIKVAPLYIDLSSLITLELLNLLDVVKRLFPKIFFTQSVIDMILFFDNEISQPHYQSAIIRYGKLDDFVIENSSEQIVKKIRERIRRIKTFVLSGDNIQIIGTVLNPKRIIKKQIDDFLINYEKVDITESDTMSFSYLEDCQAMIESVALRAAFNYFDNSPISFGIDSLLKYFLENSLILESKYYLSLTLLIENNYKQIPISVKHLFFIIQYEGYVILRKHNRLFNIFASQEYNFINIVDMIISLLNHIWNDIIPSEKKKFEWSDYLFGIIALNPLMNDEWESRILNSVSTYIRTRQNSISFIEYIKYRMLSSETVKNSIF